MKSYSLKQFYNYVKQEVKNSVVPVLCNTKQLLLVFSLLNFS